MQIGVSIVKKVPNIEKPVLFTSVLLKYIIAIAPVTEIIIPIVWSLFVFSFNIIILNIAVNTGIRVNIILKKDIGTNEIAFVSSKNVNTYMNPMKKRGNKFLFL